MAALPAVLWLLVLAVQNTAGPGKSVAELVRQAPPGARWISYKNYYQGLAFYTRNRVVVVDGTSELAYGRKRMGTDAARWFDDGPGALGLVADRLQAETPARPVLALARASDWQRLGPAEQARWEEVARSPLGVVARRR